MLSHRSWCFDSLRFFSSQAKLRSTTQSLSLAGRANLIFNACSSRLTPALAATAGSTAIYKNQRFSDHAPLTVGYDFAL